MVTFAPTFLQRGDKHKFQVPSSQLSQLWPQVHVAGLMIYSTNINKVKYDYLVLVFTTNNGTRKNEKNVVCYVFGGTLYGVKSA